VGRPAELAIRGARIFYRGELLEGCICISEGVIAYIGKEVQAPRAQEVINAKGLLALPGPIDVHVHLRDEELAYKEDFYTGTSSAVAGGITCVLDMPNTLPPVDSARRLRERVQKAAKSIVANVGFYSLFPPDPSGLAELAGAGAVGIKVYFHEPKTALDVWDEHVLRSSVELANRHGLTVAFHAEDPVLIRELAGEIRGGPVEAFLAQHPPKAEVRAIKKLSRVLAGLEVHICHVSTPEGLRLAREANFTVEATPHHLFLTSDLYGKLGSLALVDPPLRPRELVENLRKAFYSGLVDVVASDHAPHALEEKEGPNPPPGFPGLETLLPALLNEVCERRLSLPELVRMVCEGPAKIFGLKRGRLEVGWPADLVLVDLKARRVVWPEFFRSKAKYSPFAGMTFRGVPVHTIVNGVLAFSEGEIVAKPGCGSIIRPSGAGRPSQP